MFKDKKNTYIFLIALLPILIISVLPWIGSVKAQDSTLGDTEQYVYFDLAAGDVLFNGEKYRGYIYETDENNVTQKKLVEGNIKTDNGKKYYIYQSLSDGTAGLIYNPETGEKEMKLPVYDPVKTNDGKLWGDFITNNTSPEEVQEAWRVKDKEKFGRVSTANRIYVVGASGTNPTFVFDNLWSNFNNTSDGNPDKYPVAFYSQRKNDITVQLKGDNRFSEIWAVSNEKVSVATNASKNTIDNLRPSDAGKLIVENYPEQSGTLTLTCPIGDLANNSSIFGGDDKKELEISSSWAVTTKSTSKTPSYGFSNIYIEDGNVYVGVPQYLNSKWSSTVKVTHGLGSRNLSYITINGGTVTAVSNSTAAAIGGGGGYRQAGGVGCVKITGGEVYAYNNSIYSDAYKVVVPSTAIGSGSCIEAASTVGVVEITGGTVHAESRGGLAIGGGSSAQANGGDGYVTISGGDITAYSTYGNIAKLQYTTGVGVAIGGGVGAKDGGNAVVNISGEDTKIVSGSVGGGNTTGSGKNGYAEVEISGGDISAQFVMEGGGSKNCSFKMSGGTIHNVDASKYSNEVGRDKNTKYVYANGGAVWMKDPNGVATISGGSIKNCTAIQGGAIYMTGGAFKMTGGSISGCKAVGSDGDDGNGGAVHIKNQSTKDAIFEISGGDISGNSATNDGGGIFLENAKVNILGGTIEKNTASNDGGGICVDEGTITMYGGSVSNNKASNGSGGGMYVSANNNPTLIDLLSGSIGGNEAYDNGGGIAVESATNQKIDFIMGCNIVHTDEGIPYDGRDLGPGHAGHTNHIAGLIHTSCPLVDGNKAINGEGGGFYLNHIVNEGGTDNSKVDLQIYCLEEKNNTASNPDSNGMFMQGGIVEIFGDKNYTGVGEPACNVTIGSEILVEGGQVSVYGTMDNPHFDAPITVNILDPEKDFFKDNRFNNNNSDKHEFFTVSYNENFNDRGTYRQIQYEIDEESHDFTIAENLFEHEGYRLLEWNTKKDGTGTKFDVGAHYNYLENPDGENVWVVDEASTGDRATLTLYAIWEKVVYHINYVPNAPEGVSCSGEMSIQTVTMLGTNFLSQNRYSIPNYEFMGWSLNKEGDGERYADGCQIDPPFTDVNGNVVNLYAQWELCTHKNCELTVEDNIIKQKCVDCGHIATASISAEDAVYDGSGHPAKVTYSAEWVGDKNLEISYDLHANAEWDSKDEIDDNFISSMVPVHAGTYTATVDVGNDNSVSCEYEIQRIKWPSAPSSPDVQLNSNFDVTISSTSEGGNIEYSKVEGTANPSDWSSVNKYEGLTPGKYYTFYAKITADRDHDESDISESQLYLYTGGNSIVYHNEPGIMITPFDEDNSFKFTVGLKDGYHYKDHKVSTTVNGSPNDNVECIMDSFTDSKYSYTVNVSSTISGSLIDIYVSGAVKDCTVDSYIISKEVFTPFKNNTATISADSAFTTRFVVNDYLSSEYTNQRFEFGKELPKGTTLILKESNSSYWYYNVDTPTSEIAVNDFARMGSVEDEITEAALTESNFVYQLIVDFSDVEVLRLNGDLSVSLRMDSDTGVPNIDATVTASLVNVAKFNITPANNTTVGNTLTANCTYTPSTGDASIWDRRNTALVLTPKAGIQIPSDLSLTIYNGLSTIKYTMNENRQFIIPLGAVASYTDLKLTLNSDVFTKEDIVFDVEWIVSPSISGQAPLNGYIAAKTEWTFTQLYKKAPSIKISDVDNPGHIYDAGSSVPVDISYLNVPEGYRIYIQLYNKDVYTAWNVYIDDLDNSPTRISIPAGNKGSYSIRVSVQRPIGNDDYANVFDEPVNYYFIVK